MKKMILLLAMLVPAGKVLCQNVDLQQILADNKLAAVPASDVQPMQDGDKKGITIKNNVVLCIEQLKFCCVDMLHQCLL